MSDATDAAWQERLRSEQERRSRVDVAERALRGVLLAVQEDVRRWIIGSDGRIRTRNGPPKVLWTELYKARPETVPEWLWLQMAADAWALLQSARFVLCPDDPMPALIEVAVSGATLGTVNRPRRHFWARDIANAELTRKQADVVFLYLEERRTIAEIVREMKISRKTVEQHLIYAAEKLTGERSLSALDGCSADVSNYLFADLLPSPTYPPNEGTRDPEKILRGS